MLLRIFVLLLFISQPLSAQQDMKTYLDSAVKSVKVSLIIQDLHGRTLYEQNSQSKIPSARILKIPILFTLFAQIEKGKVRLDEQYELIQNDIVGGSGELQHQPVESYYSIESLAREMIRVSDNTATNIIINRLELSSINLMLAELGLKSTQLNRLMMDFDAVASGRQNYTSPAEMAQLLLLLHTSDFLSSSSRELILDILLNCDDSTTIPSQLPADIAVAHKTGILEYVRGDAGIIFSPNPIIMSVFVEEFNGTEEAEQIIGTVARIAFEKFGIGR